MEFLFLDFGIGGGIEHLPLDSGHGGGAEFGGPWSGGHGGGVSSYGGGGDLGGGFGGHGLQGIDLGGHGGGDLGGHGGGDLGGGDLGGSDYHGGVSIVSIGSGKSLSLDLTGGRNNFVFLLLVVCLIPFVLDGSGGKIFGGSFISAGAHGKTGSYASGGHHDIEGYGGDLGGHGGGDIGAHYSSVLSGGEHFEHGGDIGGGDIGGHGLEGHGLGLGGYQVVESSGGYH